MSQVFAVGVLTKSDRKVGVSWPQIFRQPLRTARFVQFWLLLLLFCLLLPGAVQGQQYVMNETRGVDALLSNIESPTFQRDLEKHGENILVLFAALPDSAIGVAQYATPGFVEVYLDLDKVKRLRITPAELELLLVHEFYGHAFAYLENGVPCSDPELGEAWADSCVAEREGVILAELGHAERAAYAIDMR